MARTYLESGQNPQIRRLAEQIVASQQVEIGQMREWSRPTVR
jgi:uncharacterized protein (DUF305 family)